MVYIFFPFGLQNGQVFVFTGLLTAVSDIHQLSFILGHEMAHAVLGHAVSVLSIKKRLNTDISFMMILFVNGCSR